MPLLASAALLVATSRLLARSLGAGSAERFWLFVAAVPLQLGTLAVACSLAGRLEPATWVAAQLLLSGAVLGAAALRRRPRSPAPTPRRTSPAHRPRGAAAAAGGLLVLFLALSALRQAASPVEAFDDRMYHASRTLYWLQHQSVLPWESHNDRQVVLSFGSELLFFWPVLLSRAELWGRLAAWLGFPAAALGLVTLVASLRAGRTVALGCGALFAATPVVWELSCGLSPELWVAAFAAGTAFWALRGIARPSRANVAFPAAGVCLALAVNIKFTALALGPALAFVPLLLPRGRPRGRAALLLAGGVVAGALGSGLAVPLVSNTIRHGHPLGPRPFRRVVESGPGVRQALVHAARAPFLLFELPVVPDAVRGGFERAWQRLADAVGATRLLPLEGDPGGWPGRFAVTVAPRAERFSLVGPLWLVALAAAAVTVARRSLAPPARPRPRLLALLLAMSLSSLLAVLLLVRWMPASRVPERFLPFALILGVATGAHLFARALRRRPVAAASACLLVAVAGPSLLALSEATRRASGSLPSVEALDHPYEEVVTRLPAGSRLLLVGSQDTPDYPLFAPRDGSTREVVSWGKRPLDLDGLLARVRETGVTHVLFQDGALVDLHWDPPLRTHSVIEALRADRRFRELPNRRGPGRLFRVVAAARAAGLPDQVRPCRVRLGRGWHGLEREGSRWWRWSPGSGTVVVFSPEPAEALLDLELISRDVPNRVTLLLRGRSVATIDVGWQGFGAVPQVRLDLEAGANTLTVLSWNPPGKSGTDPRPLAVGVGQLHVSTLLPCTLLP